MTELSLSLIEADAENGRGADAEENIEELAESIRTNGVLQPILVRPLANGTASLADKCVTGGRLNASGF